MSAITRSKTARKPEVMSPAGHWPQLHAAIEAGADSVYFGLKHFTARAKVGFTLAELPEAMATLHRRGAKGFLTFNTLVFEHELAEAARAIEAVAKAGVDALIVQDAGIVKLARQIAPGLELHGSTQMSITSVEGIEMARSLGVQRVTMARELSLDDLRAIRAKTDCELEIFVHGALCVAYSGQCFSSEAWGGRSANRGQCAQACRLPYEMVVDGQVQPLGDARYLLSPGDLYAINQIPAIVEIGISALKIEGRYKDADYVALTTAAYRKAVDSSWNGRPVEIDPIQELQLEQAYSRGLAPSFLTGTNHQAVVEGRSPRHRGVWLGSVAEVLPEAILIDTAEIHRIAPLKAGDGIVLDAADWRSPEEPEEGGRIYQATPRGDRKIEVRFANGAIDFARIRPGDRIWRTHDPDLDKATRPYREAVTPLARQLVDVRVEAREGQPLATVWQIAKHHNQVVHLSSTEPLGHALSRPMTAEYLRDQLGRLGNTPYELGTLALQVEGAPFAPASILNQLRREAVERLSSLQAAPRPIETHPYVFPPASVRVTPAPVAAEVHLLVRTPEQMDAAIELRPASITLDYLDLFGLIPSVEKVKASGIGIRVASPRVLKPNEDRIVDFLLRLDCPILVRSTGLLESLRERNHPALTGDFSLNAANSVSAVTFLNLGLARLTPTHDLNGAQVAQLARNIGPGLLEAIAYQHLPVFHTEHCVFCRFLSTGTSYKDCGRPCETHRVEVRDLSGRSHPVMADIGCRNTVFGAQAQEASAHLETWRKVGIQHFRLEFVHESAAEVRRVTRSFLHAIAGDISYAQLGQEWRSTAPQGVTEGSLFVPRGYLELPILQ